MQAGERGDGILVRLLHLRLRVAQQNAEPVVAQARLSWPRQLEPPSARGGTVGTGRDPPGALPLSGDRLFDTPLRFTSVQAAPGVSAHPHDLIHQIEERVRVHEQRQAAGRGDDDGDEARGRRLVNLRRRRLPGFLPSPGRERA